MEKGINRVEDGWDVRSMRGIGIGEVIIGSALRLHTGSNRIEVHSPAELTTESETLLVHASGRVNLDRLPQLLDQVVAEVHAADSGSLRVRFAHGWRLDVPVSPSAFGWIIGLRGSYFISSLPGGGVKMPDRPQA
ncbi:DUF6188 family protein [Streptacidiphilus jiangxiensis]|uniref:Uncharacterized protein n=1 Tax=Streptacidiphilus jiangxiensis TaxID=235985 RepID=A0A1H7P5K0_STRJI|nr:DUF6188 family protein [Streptacidiphilus jiangxiensis]SEL30367.1 hypothetical protein SAMN05414137_107206 [Streptacidiphilus jiangxiensis]